METAIYYCLLTAFEHASSILAIIHVDLAIKHSEVGHLRKLILSVMKGQQIVIYLILLLLLLTREKGTCGTFLPQLPT